MTAPSADKGILKETYLVISTPIRYCRITPIDGDKPIAAIEYDGKIYSFFRNCTDWAEAEKISGRLSEKHVLTPITKGWVIWVLEEFPRELANNP